MNSKLPSKTLLAITWLALVVLHFTILGGAYLNLEWFNTPFILVLAVIQMLLIMGFFMEVRWSNPLVRLFVAAGFFWLLIQFILTMSDYSTRGWH